MKVGKRHKESCVVEIIERKREPSSRFATRRGLLQYLKVLSSVKTMPKWSKLQPLQLKGPCPNELVPELQHLGNEERAVILSVIQRDLEFKEALVQGNNGPHEDRSILNDWNKRVSNLANSPAIPTVTTTSSVTCHNNSSSGKTGATVSKVSELTDSTKEHHYQQQERCKDTFYTCSSATTTHANTVVTSTSVALKATTQQSGKFYLCKFMPSKFLKEHGSLQKETEIAAD